MKEAYSMRKNVDLVSAAHALSTLYSYLHISIESTQTIFLFSILFFPLSSIRNVIPVACDYEVSGNVNASYRIINK